MATHSFHEDVHLAGLADGCEACSEAAENPFKFLDDDMLREFVKKVLNSETRFEFRSDAEGIAMREVMNALERAGRLYAIAALPVSEYLTTKWGPR